MSLDAAPAASGASAATVHREVVPAAPPREWSRAQAAAKVVKTPFWFIWMTPFVLGYLASAPPAGFRQPAFAAIVTLGIGLGDAVCNLHNEIVDRRIDQVNQPNRAALLDAIGVPVALVLVAVGYACAAVAIVVIAMRVNGTVAGCIAAAAATGFVYNSGPKLKRRPLLAEVAIGGAVYLMFLAGWHWHEPAAGVPASGWFLALFMGATVFLKDLPDAEGDARVGAFGIFTMSNRRARQVALAAIYAVPYAVLVGLVAADELSPRTLALLALSPVAAFCALAADRVVTGLQKLLVYQLSFLYVHAFGLGLLVLEVATPAAWAAGAALVVARLTALRFGLDPRLVEPGFRWRSGLASVWAITVRHDPSRREPR